MMKTIRSFAAAFERRLSNIVRRPIRRAVGYAPPVGAINLGDLNRLSPIDGDFGYGRGQPVDRYYVEAFLENHSADIRGHVLEIGDSTYTLRFGGDRVTTCSVWNLLPGTEGSSYTGDLADADHVPDDLFDCVIFTQTLHLIYDFHRALHHLQRMLKPEGVLLATVPGITQIDRGEWGGCWYWSFTPASMRRMLSDAFDDNHQVRGRGNVLTATSFLHGLATSELDPKAWTVDDDAYPVIITARAVKRVHK